MGVVVRAILLGAHVAKRAWTKGNHKERPDVDVEPEGKREGVSLGQRCRGAIVGNAPMGL